MKGITSEAVRGELESRKGFQRQSIRKYLRLTLVFMRSGAHSGKNVISVFQEFLPIIGKMFILAGGLTTRL